MAHLIRVPEFSEDQNTISVVKWLKNEGDPVSIGDVILELETDKSLLDFESEYEGFLLYIKVPKGNVSFNDILGVIGNKEENAIEYLQSVEGEINQKIDKTKGLDVIRLPQLSDLMEEARIVSWKVNLGDNLKIGDVIAEVETDKAVIEIESFREGTILYRLNDENPIKVGTILLIVGEEGADFKELLEETI